MHRRPRRGCGGEGSEYTAQQFMQPRAAGFSGLNLLARYRAPTNFKPPDPILYKGSGSTCITDTEGVRRGGLSLSNSRHNSWGYSPAGIALRREFHDLQDPSRRGSKLRAGPRLLLRCFPHGIVTKQTLDSQPQRSGDSPFFGRRGRVSHRLRQ